ncbi:MAG: hypothetical protein IJM30_08435 [Thermoguttaceae bacterium]|nr:hypothetical protein [Thermoguttaceae bacterium]
MGLFDFLRSLGEFETPFNTVRYDPDDLAAIEALGLTARTQGVVWNDDGRLIKLTVYDTEYTEIKLNERLYLQKLDVSRCVKLRKLDCSRNGLLELNVAGLSNLERLECNHNRLTRLDVSSCAKLETLQCFNNELTELDVSGCQALTGIFCGFNRFAELDVSGCRCLERLNCESCGLTKLDVSACSNLLWLWTPNNWLTELNVSGCRELQVVNCQGSRLRTVDASGCPALSYLFCDSGTPRIASCPEANQEYQLTQSCWGFPSESPEQESSPNDASASNPPHHLDLTKRPDSLGQPARKDSGRNFETREE